ncbi:sigma-70 family RNA polymerase sigma factor [Cryptosporangium phraense]|uniref:Sigma-70 family RNA polymerase sigma factor n=1 Tax=Cryptosporangium phraense TaxID=2593070 RepID=A0A545AV11_9ACTN|nr:sigma-70 family RNA polymerase sigma factor [Cryptosporangium phraense]
MGWRAAWEANVRPIYDFLLRLNLGDRQAAEDQLQETFLRAWRRFRDDAAPERPWLFTVARNIAIDAGRARRARPHEVAIDEFSPLEPRRDELDRRDDFDRRDEFDRFVESQVVRAAVRSLRPHHRETIYQLYYRDRTIAETAHELGIPAGTVKSRMSDGLTQLGRTLQKQGYVARPAAARGRRPRR